MSLDVLSTLESCYKYGELLYEYGSAVKDAPEAREAYLHEVRAIQSSLVPLDRRLRELNDGTQPIPPAFEPLIRPRTRTVAFDQTGQRESEKVHHLLHRRVNENDPKNQAPGRLMAAGVKIFDGYEAGGVLLKLHDDLAELTKKLKPDDNKKILTRLIWYWKDEGIQALVLDINRLRGEIEILLNSERDEERLKDRLVINHMDNDIREIRKTQDDQVRQAEQQKIISWLSPLRTLELQDAILKDTFPVHDRLTGSADFQAWLQGQPWWLWCYGYEGSGKTVLSAQVSQYLMEARIERGALILSLFIDYKEAARQTVADLLGSMLRQIIQAQPVGIRSQKLKQIYTESNGERKPRKEDLSSILLEEFDQASHVYLIIDGWDGISEQIRQDFEDTVYELSSDYEKVSVVFFARYSEEDSRKMSPECRNCKTPDMKIFYYCKICVGMEFCKDCIGKGYSCGHTSHEMLAEDRVHVLVQPEDAEISEYVKWEMGKTLTKSTKSKRRINPRFKTVNVSSTPLGLSLGDKPELKELIPEIVGKVAHGSFQSAKLYINSIKLLPSVKAIEESLKDLPEGLPEIYSAMMKGFADLKPSKRSETVLTALYWVAISEMPMKFPALRHAIAVEPGTTYLEKYGLIHEETLLFDSTGVINISYDETVRIHLTLHDWLHKHSQDVFAEQDVDMALKLLTYMNYEELSIPCPSDVGEEMDARLERLPLLEYASQFWAAHVRPVSSNAKVRAELLKFLSHPGNIESCLQVAYNQSSKLFTDLDIRKGANGLHLAAFHGFDDVIEDLIQNQHIEADSTDPVYGQTALMYAAKNGRLRSTEILLANGASAGLWSRRRGYALFEAFLGELGQESDHLEITKRLLDCADVDVNARCEQEARRTLLMLASYFGNLVMVDYILSNRKDSDLNLVDNLGDTALALAIAGNQRPVVERLLQDNRVKTDIRNNEDETAFDLAAKSTNTEILNVLLNQGAKTKKSTIDTENAFFTAAEQGDTDMIRVFLNRDVRVNSFDKENHNLLHVAAANGHAKVVEMLLETSLDKNLQANRGETPLHEACRNGHLEVVNLLLGAKVDTSIEDKAGRIPLDVTRENAWKQSYYRIMKLLGEDSDKDAAPLEQIMSCVSTLPMWSLARIGLLEPIKTRISEKEKWDVMERCPDTGNSVVHYAAIRPKKRILATVLDAGLDQAATNFEMRTPLHLAIEENDSEAVDMLLQYPNPPLAVLDQYGRPPLRLAQEKQKYAIAVSLVEAGAEVDPQDHTYLHPTFIEAVRQKKANVVKLLIEKGADHLKPDSDGISAKQIALNNDDIKTLQVLTLHKSVFIPLEIPNSDEDNDNDGSTNNDEDVWLTPPSSPMTKLVGPDFSKPMFVGRTK